MEVWDNEEKQRVYNIIFENDLLLHSVSYLSSYRIHSHLDVLSNKFPTLSLPIAYSPYFFFFFYSSFTNIFGLTKLSLQATLKTWLSYM